MACGTNVSDLARGAGSAFGSQTTQKPKPTRPSTTYDVTDDPTLTNITSRRYDSGINLWNTIMKTLICAAIAATLTVGSAFAHEYTAGSLSIDHPMAFETAPNVNVGGGYMTITNTGSTDDVLKEVRVDGIPRVELHLSETDENGVARMAKQDGITIPAGETVTLKPGGLHVMFMGLRDDPFELGEKIDATLVFQSAGELSVQFTVEERSAQTHADHSGHSEHKHEEKSE